MSDTVLVRANVRIAGLTARRVSEIPRDLFDILEPKGYVTSVETLASRKR